MIFYRVIIYKLIIRPLERKTADYIYRRYKGRAKGFVRFLRQFKDMGVHQHYLKV
jgi:hypothetical protein